MNKIIAVAVAVLILILPAQSFSGEPGWHFATSLMALSNSTKQGGQGPSGATLLTQTDLHYHFGFWGLGTFFQFDKQGSSETDTAVGPKIELHSGPFYFEYGYAFLMQRAFTDRTIAKQNGSAHVFGIGVRFSLGGVGGRGGTSGLFIQSVYKYRIQTIKTQDGAQLSEAISQTDGYPLFGLGYKF
ncbi:MAG: hypothetical protein AABZ55_15800 [Bdellovibrionota bacterium]